MSIIGLLIHHNKTWKLVVDRGAITAATAMLRRPSFTEEGASKACGLCYILAMVGFVGSLREEPGCLDALHTAARGRHGAAAADTARKAMAMVAEKHAKAAEIS